MDKILDKLLDEVSASRHSNERQVANSLADYVEKSRGNYGDVAQKATGYINHIRANLGGVGIEAFFQQYGLDTPEGVAVMSMAEALLRIPDADTANELIHDKLANIEWNSEKVIGTSALMKASAFGLKFVGKLFDKENLATKMADPLVRNSIKQSMRVLGGHFVMGETIANALTNSRDYQKQGYMFSYDMLGEGARSDEQAKHYLKKYLEAVETIRHTVNITDDLYKRPGISVKLSALHPRYELANKEDVFVRLIPRLRQIVDKAMLAGICVTIDAEESAKLDLSLEVFSRLFAEENYSEFEGLGLAVQAYHKQASSVIDYIIALAKTHSRLIPVRLVKGAYWDSEIKRAQVGGLEGYPVFTKKSYTDISYLACAYKMLANSDKLYPQFATHNALTIAEIEIAAEGKEFEFQLLHGMGGGVYNQVVARHRCRIYAPVGQHEDLLAYLIRRLLENSANTSFVKKVADFNVPVADILKDPLYNVEESKNIALPNDIYSPERQNSAGVDLGNKHQLAQVQKALEKFKKQTWHASPLIGGKESIGLGASVSNPYNLGHKVGKVIEAGSAEIKAALDVTTAAHRDWAETSVEKRAAILERMADLLEENKYEAIALCIAEAGRTLEDSVSEVREAVDFCRYYAMQARKLMQDQHLVSPTGETNVLSLHGRGMFFCISPWNFPLAIFLGQVTAALVMGNTVIAKPAEQTPLIAAFAVKLLIKAGVPRDVIALLPGGGEVIGKYVLSDKRLAGVVFTGSMETAKIINSELAHRGGSIVPFIAETGGQNAMIVDSSALIEQTVDDIVLSAFGSAGQRCSGLRVLYVQEDIADKLIDVLIGAMAELRLGNPADISTNIGPIIDHKACESLRKHIQFMTNSHKLIATTPINKAATEFGNFIEPHAFIINSINDLKAEVFGPILHIIIYKHNELNKIIDEINDYGYGLTLGIQSRINMRAEYIRNEVRVGNAYVNRSMIGAVVGVQPFGGEGLSGTGPKSGGPNYLLRFVTERVYTVNTAAIGGNRELLV